MTKGETKTLTNLAVVAAAAETFLFHYHRAMADVKPAETEQYVTDALAKRAAYYAKQLKK